MEYRPCDRGGGEYYSVDGYPLRDGVLAALDQHDWASAIRIFSRVT
jgi:hypothetical protein